MTGLPPEQAKKEALARFNDQGPGHINCAQAVVTFALLVLGDDLDLAVTAGYFGGGIAGTGETCGAITGAALALGLRDFFLAGESGDLRPGTRAGLQKMIEGFTAQFGARRCSDLTGCDLSTETGHQQFAESGAGDLCPGYVGWVCDRLAPLLDISGA